MGAGAVGCWVGGRIALAGGHVVFVGREHLKREIHEHGLTVTDLDGSSVTVPKERFTFDTNPAVLADCDAVLCCVKSGATIETAETLARVLASRDAIVVSFQNGIRNTGELRERLSQSVLAGIVNFNVLNKGRGTFRRATSGSLVVEASTHPKAERLHELLGEAGLEVDRVVDMPALQWSKLLINLNNSVSALSDRPTKELILSAGYRKVLSAIIAESLAVLRAANIRPAKLGAIPIGLFPFALSLPTPIVQLVARAQLKIDPEARSSMWEDLTRGRPTEIDWINGEVVRLAENVGASAPLNRLLVDLVHEAERTGKGSPKLSAEELWRALHR